MTTALTPTPLRDALYAFSLAKAVPDADLLEEFARRYPEHAEELTEFAIELAVDAARGDDEVEAELPATPISPAVSRAMSAFQNRLFSVRRVETVATASSPVASSVVTNPFVSLDRSTFRKVAQALNANSVFVGKLRDRQIDPLTMTKGFCQLVAGQVGVSVDVMAAHLAAKPEVGRQLYKAEKKPEVAAQQSFEEAVRGSGLTEEQQEHLLKL